MLIIVVIWEVPSVLHMRKKWITWILPPSQAFLGGSPRGQTRFCSSLGIWFILELLPFNVWLKVNFPLKTLHPPSSLSFLHQKWKFNVWRKYQLFLYWSWRTTYFSFRKHRCLGWTSLRNMRKAAQTLPAKHSMVLKIDFVSLLSSASSHGSDRGLFFSQWDVWGK